MFNAHGTIICNFSRLIFHALGEQNINKTTAIKYPLEFPVQTDYILFTPLLPNPKR